MAASLPRKPLKTGYFSKETGGGGYMPQPNGCIFLLLSRAPASPYTAASACSRSAIRSSLSSIPIDSRTSPCVIPTFSRSASAQRAMRRRRRVRSQRLHPAQRLRIQETTSARREISPPHRAIPDRSSSSIRIRAAASSPAHAADGSSIPDTPAASPSAASTETPPPRGHSPRAASCAAAAS